ncbi:MAG: hypothetical protein Q9205_004635, partial [Flavoplaca limonia]
MGVGYLLASLDPCNMDTAQTTLMGESSSNAFWQNPVWEFLPLSTPFDSHVAPGHQRALSGRNKVSFMGTSQTRLNGPNPPAKGHRTYGGSALPTRKQRSAFRKEEGSMRALYKRLDEIKWTKSTDDETAKKEVEQDLNDSKQAEEYDSDESAHDRSLS